MRYRPAPVLGAAFILLPFLSASAGASTIEALFVKVTPWMWFEYSADGGANYVEEIVGQYRWTRTGGDHAGPPQGEFFSFCIEISQNVVYQQVHRFDVVDLADAPQPGGMGVGAGMGQDKADLLRELWARRIGDVVGPQTAAAFQIGVWEVVYDDGLSLAEGSFRARYPALPEVALAQSWLDGLTGNGPFAPLMAMSSPEYQDHLILVPLPSAVWGGAVLLAAMAIVTRRASRRAAAAMAL